MVDKPERWITKNDMTTKCLALLNAFLFQYETPRLVTLRTKRIGLLYRLVQATLLIYLIGYVLIYTKSYQRFDIADSSVVTRIKGVLKRNVTGMMDIWDNNDFVVPAQDHNVGGKGIACSSDSDCQANVPTLYGNGIKTGLCVNHTGTCEVYGWCPTETDEAPRTPVLSGFDSITALVKNHIAFPKFNIKRRNVLDSFSEEYLKVCRFHPINDPVCPVFSIRDIVAFAHEDFDAMAVKGGVIGFNIEWDCDFDYGPQKCLPQYSFRRLDSEHDKVAKGWNFRHSYYHYDVHGMVRRDLVKYWGIRFVMLVNGRAGEFSTVHFVMHLGSSIGLFGLASLICEVALSYCHRSEILHEQKFVSLEVIKARTRHRPVTKTTEGDMQLRFSVRGSYSHTGLLRLDEKNHSPGLPNEEETFTGASDVSDVPHGNGHPIVRALTSENGSVGARHSSRSSSKIKHRFIPRRFF